MNIQSGDLIAWKSDGYFDVIANSIAMMTKGIYTHVGIAIVKDKKLNVAEARYFKGVRIRPLSDNETFDLIPTGIIWNDIIEGKVFKRLGRSYHYFGALSVGMGWKILDIDQSEICSFFVARVLKDAGFDISEYVTPQEIVTYLLQKGYVLFKSPDWKIDTL